MRLNGANAITETPVINDLSIPLAHDKHMTKDDMRKLAMLAAENTHAPALRPTHLWPKPPYEEIFKCGVVVMQPTESGNNQYYMMLPKAKIEGENPGFQIAKGTREIYDNKAKEWINYYAPNQLAELGEHNLEPLLVTAIREGIEEIGLRPETIEAIGEWGQGAFTSATTGALKTMWLYVLQLEMNAAFDEPDATYADTIARQWFRLDNAAECGKIRADHLRILQSIDNVLKS